MFNGFDKESASYVWLVAISIVGGVLNYIRNKDEDKKRSIKRFLVGMVSSMFAAYITFELVTYLSGSERVAVALGGLAAWMGTDALLALEAAYKKKITGENR